jgi:hypothetical protein
MISQVIRVIADGLFCPNPRTTNTHAFLFLDKGLQNPVSTSKDVHSQILQTVLGE